MLFFLLNTDLQLSVSNAALLTYIGLFASKIGLSLFIFLSVTLHVSFQYGIEISISSLAFLYSSQIYGMHKIFR